MSILIVAFCVFLLILLISWGKINPFLAFLIISIVAGVLLGIPISEISQTIESGIGGMLGSLAVIVCLGAMFGKVISDSGAAKKITEVLTQSLARKTYHGLLCSPGLLSVFPCFTT